MYKIDRRGGGGGGVQKSYTRTDPGNYQDLFSSYFQKFSCIMTWVREEYKFSLLERFLANLLKLVNIF